MSKEQIVQDALKSISEGQAQVLELAVTTAVEQSAQEQKASDGTLTQSDLDAAIKSATDPLNQQISDLQAKDAADIKAGQDALDQLQGAQNELQSRFDVLAQKEGKESAVIQGLKASLASIQQATEILLGLPSLQPEQPSLPETPSEP